jgi:hypothetical protein
MTLSHNSIIRGYNSIYQQAPRLIATDYADFVGYCLAWHRSITEHDKYEELYFFPAIEVATGQKVLWTMKLSSMVSYMRLNVRVAYRFE